MSSIQIPNLPAVIGLNGAELFEGVQAGTSVKISLAQIITAARGGTPATLPIPVSLGGTGLDTFTIGDIMYASATQTFSKLADVATGNAIISGGVGAAPSYGKIGLTTHVSGVLPVANGGTNITSYTIGDLIYASTAGILSKLADVATGNALISGGVGVAPSYGKIGLTTHVSGVLPVANGGTGVTTSTGTVSVVLSDSPALTGNVTVTTNSASAAVTINQTGAGNVFVVEDSASPDASPFVIDASGNVGIGTSAPVAKLDIVTGTYRAYFDDPGGASVRLNGVLANNTAYGPLTINGSILAMQTGGSERMRIDASGNVGIGTSSPTTPLSVSGDTSLGGVVYRAQPTQTSKAAAATLTIAELLTGIIQYTGAVATLTLPTGASIEGGLPATFPTNMSFDVSFINTGAALLTIGANGNTTVGTMTVATVTSAMLRFRKTAANTYTVYRIS